MAETSPEALKGALQQTDEISITVKGRRTGRAISLPVWFVLEDDRLYLLPVRGSHNHWFRNLQADPTLTIQAHGRRLTTRARPVQDPGLVRRVADQFRAKYGSDQVARYYSVFDAAVEVPLGQGG